MSCMYEAEGARPCYLCGPGSESRLLIKKGDDNKWDGRHKSTMLLLLSN